MCKPAEPLDGTTWVVRDPDPRSPFRDHYFLLNGRVWSQFRQGWPKLSVLTVAYLRSLSNVYVETPPKENTVDKPIEGTAWACRLTDIYCCDYVIRGGVLMTKPRDDRKPALRALLTVADLRAMPNEYVEMPPEKETP